LSFLSFLSFEIVFDIVAVAVAAWQWMLGGSGSGCTLALVFYMYREAVAVAVAAWHWQWLRGSIYIPLNSVDIFIPFFFLTFFLKKKTYPSMF
jgi:hypothetical protein